MYGFAVTFNIGHGACRVGYLLNGFSSHGILAQLGMLLGRGTLLSLAIVLFVLPGLLYIFDCLIRRTTKGANFYNPKKELNNYEKN